MQLLEYLASKLARLNWDIAHSLWAAGNLHLYKENLSFGPLTPLSTFLAAEADFDSYAPLAMGPPDATIALDGMPEVLNPPQGFSPSASVTPNLIYGIFITDTTNADLLFAGALDGGPISMDGPLTQLYVIVRVRLDQSLTVTIA